MNNFKIGVICILFALTTSLALAEEGHEEGGDEKEGSALMLSVDERKAAGIVVETVKMRALNEVLRVPAEVVINAYQSARVTPRMQAQVVARHARLGERVRRASVL